MLTPQHLTRVLIAALLLCTALSGAALTLGRSRGVALLGRALDVTVPVTLDSAAQAADLCLEADVFHGDTRVEASRVTAALGPVTGLAAVVRIRSSLPVDEPVVTVYLRHGCNQKVTRRYVLLAEEAGEPAPGTAAVPPVRALSPQPVPPSTSPVPLAAVTASRPPVASTPGTRSSSSGDEGSPRRAPGGRFESALAQPPRASTGSREAGSGRPRLKVDMLDLTPERTLLLRTTQDLAGEPSTSGQVRAQAAALWRSINAQPEDVLRDLQRVQALEANVKGLRHLTADNDRTLLDLREQLKQARQERSVALGVVALLTLLLAAAIVSWWLRRSERARARDWWRRRGAVSVAAEHGADAPPAAVAPVVPARAGEMDLRVDESMFDSLKAPPRGKQSAAVIAAAPAAASAVVTGAPTRPPGFYASQAASMRMVRTEELVDIQQQADFFMSLGQADQAIEVLESHIRENAETSALVWLDLLAIYRTLKRRADYESLRGDFQRVFNADVPGYDSTHTSSGGLEDYPRALSRIAALWPSPKVLEVIEESIFRKPGMSEGEPFDLEAYRELVMLYNLGREIVEEMPGAGGELPRQEAGGSDFFDTSVQPLSQVRRKPQPNDAGDEQQHDLHVVVDSMLDDSDEPGTIVDGMHDPQIPRPSPRLGLDIDLSAPARSDKQGPLPGARLDFELSEPGEPGKPA